MTKYCKYKIHLSEGQKTNLKNALLENKSITLKFTNDDLKGEDILALTMRQIDKIHNAKDEDKGVTITMSKTQLLYNKKMKGGSLAVLAGLLARAAPIAKTLGTTLGLSALSGAAQTGIQKLLGGGLYLKRNGHAMQIESDGKGLYLRPFNGKGLKSAGDGLYLKSQEKWIQGEGLILGQNSPLKNIPVLGWLL